MHLAIVAAVADNGVIGRAGDLPWRLRTDLRRLRALTVGHTVILGRRTHEAILRRLGRPLPERRTIVLTRRADYPAEGVEVVHSWEEALARAADAGEVFVFGGAEVFAVALPHAHRFYLTRVHAAPEGDATFPAWDPGAWRVVWAEHHPRDAENEYDATYLVLERARGPASPPEGAPGAAGAGGRQ